MKSPTEIYSEIVQATMTAVGRTARLSRRVKIAKGLGLQYFIASDNPDGAQSQHDFTSYMCIRCLLWCTTEL
jgi:hypothetical protein